MQHDACRFVARFLKKPLQDMHDEFHGCVVVIQHQDFVHSRLTGFGAGLDHHPRSGSFSSTIAPVAIAHRAFANPSEEYEPIAAPVGNPARLPPPREVRAVHAETIEERGPMGKELDWALQQGCEEGLACKGDMLCVDERAGPRLLQPAGSGCSRPGPAAANKKGGGPDGPPPRSPSQ
jgi:hypothetical protein